MSGPACPACGEPTPEGARFCEACGTPLGGPVVGSEPGAAAPTATEAAPLSRSCVACGGVVGTDGWCETCGAKAPSERDHLTAEPADWVAAVSDRGRVHHRNEDGVAVSATPEAAAPERRAVLVVMDGVSRTDDSALASLTGATAALAALAAPLPHGMGAGGSREAAVAQVMAAAVRAADDEVVAATTPGTDRPASATFTAVVLEGTTVWHANIGDSRSYWLPDAGPGVQLTVDDSGAQLQIAAGVPRAEAERSPQAHAITAWLGSDSPSLVPTVGHVELDGPGWLLACSDGLWNYASEPAELRARIDALAVAGPGAPAVTPSVVAHGLVGFANDAGGQDNITVAIARVPGADPGHDEPTDTPGGPVG